MKNKTYKVPIQTVVDLKTGESKTTYKTLTASESREYEKQVLDPFARSIFELMKRDIESGEFVPGEGFKDKED